MKQDEGVSGGAATRGVELIAEFGRLGNDRHESLERLLIHGAGFCERMLGGAVGFFGKVGPDCDRLIVEFIDSDSDKKNSFEVGVCDQLFGDGATKREPAVVVLAHDSTAPLERGLVEHGHAMLVKSPIYAKDRFLGVVGGLLSEVRELESEEWACLDILAQLLGMKHEVAAQQTEMERIASAGTCAESPETGKRRKERRRHRRIRFHFVQYIAPIRNSRQPTLKEFYPVECRDISRSGLAFLLPRAPDFSKALVALGRPPVFVHCLAEVVRTERVRTDRGPRILVGCRFLQRIAF